MSEFQRFWYGWKMWSFAFTATWHACPQSEGLGSAVNLSDAASSLNTAYPPPPLFGKLLLSFSMTKACVKTSGTSTTKGASVLFLGFHWSFTILEPSGKAGRCPEHRSCTPDHDRVGDDDLEHFIGPGGRNHRPVLVSLEVRE